MQPRAHDVSSSAPDRERDTVRAILNIKKANRVHYPCGRRGRHLGLMLALTVATGINDAVGYLGCRVQPDPRSARPPQPAAAGRTRGAGPARGRSVMNGARGLLGALLTGAAALSALIACGAGDTFSHA